MSVLRADACVLDFVMSSGLKTDYERYCDNDETCQKTNSETWFRYPGLKTLAPMRRSRIRVAPKAERVEKVWLQVQVPFLRGDDISPKRMVLVNGSDDDKKILTETTGVLFKKAQRNNRAKY